jgi:hypothetical protein
MTMPSIIYLDTFRRVQAIVGLFLQQIIHIRVYQLVALIVCDGY